MALYPSTYFILHVFMSSEDYCINALLLCDCFKDHNIFNVLLWFSATTARGQNYVPKSNKQTNKKPFLIW